jgi:hypothetical protein
VIIFWFKVEIRSTLSKEIELLKRIKNANVVSYFGTCPGPEEGTLWVRIPST